MGSLFWRIATCLFGVSTATPVYAGCSFRTEYGEFLYYPDWEHFVAFWGLMICYAKIKPFQEWADQHPGLGILAFLVLYGILIHLLAPNAWEPCQP